MVKAIALSFFLLTISGCASISGDTISMVSVQTISSDGNEVTGSKCELMNDKGKFFLTSPGTLTIPASNENLIVTCKKPGMKIGLASVMSETNGSMFGNILFGGGIGAIMDHSSGAAYDYPPFIQIIMGENILIGEEQESIDEQSPLGNSTN
tara:strand:- start:350 stop:805 length:456 start_codon:yes stop_codon:yes gene_type:complete